MDLNNPESLRKEAKIAELNLCTKFVKQNPKIFGYNIVLKKQPTRFFILAQLGDVRINLGHCYDLQVVQYKITENEKKQNQIFVAAKNIAEDLQKSGKKSDEIIKNLQEKKIPNHIIAKIFAISVPSLYRKFRK